MKNAKNTQPNKKNVVFFFSFVKKTEKFTFYIVSETPMLRNHYFSRFFPRPKFDILLQTLLIVGVVFFYLERSDKHKHKPYIRGSFKFFCQFRAMFFSHAKGDFSHVKVFFYASRSPYSRRQFEYEIAV